MSFSGSFRAHIGNLVPLKPVGAPAIREDHDVGVRRSHKQVADKVLLAGSHADATLASPSLIAVIGDCRAFDVPSVADRDRHILFGNQVLDTEFALVGKNFRAPRVAVLRLYLTELVHDN